MRIGLIGDLAIGMDRSGSHAWARQSDLLLGLAIGAPPDAFNPRGQDWGLTGFSPRALVAQGFKNKEMAEKMFISEQTVKNHLHNIFDKLGVSDRLELALYAIHKKLHV